MDDSKRILARGLAELACCEYDFKYYYLMDHYHRHLSNNHPIGIQLRADTLMIPYCKRSYKSFDYDLGIYYKELSLSLKYVESKDELTKIFNILNKYLRTEINTKKVIGSSHSMISAPTSKELVHNDNNLVKVLRELSNNKVSLQIMYK